MESTSGELRLRFARLNLPRSHAVEFSVIGIYKLNAQRETLIGDQFEPASSHGPKLGMFGSVSYRLSGVVHRIRFTLARDITEPDECAAFVRYQATQEASASPRTVGTTESEFLELVNQLGEAQEGAFRGRFDYPEAAAKDLWFPLPVKMAGRSDNDTYEIRGVRGAKVSESEEEPEYLFNLDRPTSEEVTLSIDSEVNGPIDLANSRALFAQSVAISRELVGSG